MLKVSFNWRRASEAMVSKTMDDLPDPDTPVKTVILRLGMRNETFCRLLLPGAANLDVFLGQEFSRVCLVATDAVTVRRGRPARRGYRPGRR